ncbi:MAG: hypothetical protein ACI8VT_001399 [Saprospiraceae bacterium]|jgi:hypothetical protein
MSLPILAPIIIGAVGTFVGNFFQEKSAKIAQDRLLKAAILKKAEAVYDEMSKTIDTVYYYLVEEAIYIAIRAAQGDPSRSEEDEAGWLKFDAAMLAWKSNQNRLISEIEVYYGKENSALLESIGDRIKTGDTLIGATYYKTSSSLVDKEIDWAKATDEEKKAPKDYFFDAVFKRKPLEKDIRKLNRQVSQLLQSQEVAELG